MDYFLWNTTGDLEDRSLCFIEDPPPGMGLRSAALALGKSAKKRMPERPQIRLRKENPGLVLPGFIGNTRGYLILSTAGVRVVEEACAGQKIDVHPFELLDHEGRVHSTDYAIVNPLTKVACLAIEESGATVDDDGEIVVVKRVVLRRAALAKAPHLFRIAEMRTHYVFSRTLGRAFNTAQVSNVRGSRLAQV